jgi:hypothetical protein
MILLYQYQEFMSTTKCIAGETLPIVFFLLSENFAIRPR